MEAIASVGEVVEEKHAEALRQKQQLNLRAAVDFVQDLDFLDDNEELEEYIEEHGQEKNR